ncbi:hypothetical protein LCGC14_3121750 [marine sediment metagenome]|uniref:HNH nuclease domain-containing protein n=1 Tax=marine sediment metagenome TaxID=412755 RepID=A0A0F8Y9I1_9ZZZZ
MKQIELTQGMFALVDNDVFEELSRYKWYARKGGHTFYAMRSVYLGGGQANRKNKTVLMHRVIIGALKGQHVDHRNGDGLYNLRCNIRANFTISSMA